MFPLIFYKVCVCVKFLLCNIYLNSSEFRMMSMKYVQKPFLEGKFYVRSKFSCVRSSRDLCARAHVNSLEGTLHWSQLGLLIQNFEPTLILLTATTTLHSFIHSGYFCNASSSQLLLRGAPNYSIYTASELTRQSTTRNYE